MNYCIIPPKRESAFWLVTLVLFILVSFVWIVFLESFRGIVLSVFILFILFWFAMLLLSIANLIMQNRKYAISEHGITISNIGSRNSFYSWQAFRDVGICKVHYTSRLPYEYDVVIRFSLIHENTGPKSGVWGFWATEIYELLHFRQIILLTFSQERFNQLVSVYPNEISDYRTIMKNSFDIS